MSKATWIWYPGDFEIWLNEKVHIRRKVRGGIYPATWRLDRHYSSVSFCCNIDLQQEEEISIHADGEFSLYLDGKDSQRFTQSKLVIPAGKHEIRVAVYNDTAAPAIFIQGDTIATNADWQVTCHDKQWHQAGCWNFDHPDHPPSAYKLATREIFPERIERNHEGWVVDFGKETFGYLKLNQAIGHGGLTIYYGESLEEALDDEYCLQTDSCLLHESSPQNYSFPESRAFRYVRVQADKGQEEGLQIESISMLYEYLPVHDRGQFQCSDETLNKIWETSLYTLRLNTREFFLDGIKRDRWVWSGDAYQTFLMNYYSYFDTDIVKRTLIALRGKDPITTHLNTILDYSFYWFIGLYDYLVHTGDEAFIRAQYASMVSLMDYCLTRLNQDGLIEGHDIDWVFVDWADIDNQGAVCFEQLLFCKSLEAMALFAGLANDPSREQQYQNLARDIKQKTFDLYWNEESGGLVHHYKDGQQGAQITKHASMLALLLGYLNNEQEESIKQNVLLNPDIQAITTPYMRFYELAALCEIGEHKYVTNEMISYWGGMLALGATTFWETYDPTATGLQHYEMYGSPYGKSLCHGWGASPIYLLGKYYIGVKPSATGYATYDIEPNLGGLDWIKGTVPIYNGEISLFMDSTSIQLTATAGAGTLRIHSLVMPSTNQTGCITPLCNNVYEIEIVGNGQEIVIQYLNADNQQ